MRFLLPCLSAGTLKAVKGFASACALGVAVTGSMSGLCASASAQSTGPLDQYSRPSESAGFYLGPLDARTVDTPSERREPTFETRRQHASRTDWTTRDRTGQTDRPQDLSNYRQAQKNRVATWTPAPDRAEFPRPKFDRMTARQHQGALSQLPSSSPVERSLVAERPRYETADQESVGHPTTFAPRSSPTLAAPNPAIGSSVVDSQSLLPMEAIDRPAFESAAESNYPDRDRVTRGPVILPEAFDSLPQDEYEQEELEEGAERSILIQEDPSDDLRQVQHTSIDNFQGTFAEFQAKSARRQYPEQTDHYFPGSNYHANVASHGGDQRNRPTAYDYERHGLAGYGDRNSVNTFGYQDGAAFGFDQTRLHHPLEGPATYLLGSPTVLPNFGAESLCDEWEGFCGGKDLGYYAPCGGLKATPGHLGIPWLSNHQPCEQTTCLSCRKCRSKCRCGKGFQPRQKQGLLSDLFGSHRCQGGPDCGCGQ